MSTETPLPKQRLIEAATKAGGQTKLADALTAECGKRVSQQWIWNVINRDQDVPPEWCLPIERITEGEISRHDLRPDLYPVEERSAA